jgi:hypothetical protein
MGIMWVGPFPGDIQVGDICYVDDHKCSVAAFDSFSGKWGVVSDDYGITGWYTIERVVFPALLAPFKEYHSGNLSLFCY